MRRSFLVVAASVVAAVALVPAALAANAHFIDNQPNPGDPSCTWDGGNTISCSFKIAGLGNVSQVKANIGVTRTCTVQSGANSPPGQLKSRTVTLAVDNGQTTADPPQVFTFKKLNCPGTQTTDLGDSVDFFINGKFIGSVPLTTV
jgi:hypothetical protein